MDINELKIEWGEGVFAVPDKAALYTGMSGAAELRLLIFLCAQKRFPSPEEIKVSQDELEDAVNFWTVNGVLKKPAAVTEKAAPVKKTVPSFKTISPAQIANSIDSDPMLKRLFTELEMINGKPFNHTEQQCFVWIHEFLKLPPEVVLMLYSFAKDEGKASMSYISKVAQDWCTRDINTVGAAGEELLVMQKKKTECDRLTAVLKEAGITGNHASAVTKWQRNGVSDELLRYTIEAVKDKTKLNIEYIGKILDSYRKEGISDPEAARARDDAFRAQKEKPEREHIYNGDEIEAELIARVLNTPIDT